MFLKSSSEHVDNEDCSQGRGMNAASGRYGARGGHCDERYVVRVQINHKLMPV